MVLEVGETPEDGLADFQDHLLDTRHTDLSSPSRDDKILGTIFLTQQLVLYEALMTFVGSQFGITM